VQLRRAARDADGAPRVRQCNDFEPLEEFSKKAPDEYVRWAPPPSHRPSASCKAKAPTCSSTHPGQPTVAGLGEACMFRLAQDVQDGHPQAPQQPRTRRGRGARRGRRAARGRPAQGRPQAERGRARGAAVAEACRAAAPRAAPHAGAAVATGGAGDAAWAAAPAGHADAPAPPELTWVIQGMDADSVALLERAGNRLSITAVLGKSSAYCGAAPEADAPGEPDLDASLTRTDSDDIYISLLLPDDPPHESYAAHAYDAADSSTVVWDAALDAYPPCIAALDPVGWVLAVNARNKRAGALPMERPDSGGSASVLWAAASAGAGA